MESINNYSNTAATAGWMKGQWGNAESVAIRLIFFSEQENPHKLDVIRKKIEELREGKGRDLVGRIRALVEPARSMHVDLVTPQFALDDRLPIMLCCEGHSDGRPMSPPLNKVTLAVKPTVEMEWEGRLSSVSIGADKTLEADLVDGFYLFEDGLVAYFASLVFESSQQAPVPFPAPLLLLLESVWTESAGKLNTEDAVTIRWSRDTEEKSLVEFLQDRLRHLREPEGSNTAAPPTSNLFSLLKSIELPTNKSGGQLSDLLADVLDVGNSRIAARQAVRATSIGIEVLGYDRHQTVVDLAKKAITRTLEKSEFSQMVAALTQNIFDYTEQDQDELCDSLSAHNQIGTEIAFANRGIGLKFSERSRPFSDWSSRIGGSPYWFLVEAIAGHNKIVLQRALEIERKLTVAARVASKSRGDISKKLGQARDLQENLDSYIPNIFRYQTERSLWKLFSDRWDLDIENTALLKSQQSRELAIMRDDEILKEQENKTLNRRLFALSVIQAGGAIAAVASIQEGRVVWGIISVVIMLIGAALAFLKEEYTARLRRIVLWAAGFFFVSYGKSS